MSQITLLTGPERRRRWRDEDRLAILEEAFAAGACVTEVARRWEVSSSLIYTWRRNMRSTVAAPAFVEAFVADVGVRPKAGGDPVIRIELAAARVSVCASASPALVGAVLKALR